MKTLLVARKSMVELLREWQLLLLVVMVPLAFLGITAFAYSGPLLVTHPILVTAGHSDLGELLAGDLQAQRYARGRPVFEVSQATDPDSSMAALKDRTATALVTVAGDGTAVTITGDALHPRFSRVGTLLDTTIFRVADSLSGRAELVRIVQKPLGAASPHTEFDLYVPGMIIFALLMIIPQTAMLVAREVRWKTLGRLRLTPLHARDLLGGISLSQMAVAVVQVVLVFLAALLMGFHNQGSLLLAIVIGLAVSFSAIGMGLLVACFVENDSQAINVGSTVAMIQVFLCGALYQLPPLTVYTLLGHQIDIFDVFPATHGFSALQQVLTYGAGLQQIAFRLGATLVLSFLYFGLGVVIFQRLRMRERA